MRARVWLIAILTICLGAVSAFGVPAAAQDGPAYVGVDPFTGPPPGDAAVLSNSEAPGAAGGGLGILPVTGIALAVLLMLGAGAVVFGDRMRAFARDHLSRRSAEAT